MRPTRSLRSRTRPVVAAAAVGALVVTLAACDDGSASKSSDSTTSTSKPRKHGGSTTTTSAAKGGSTTTTPTTVPAGGGTCGAATGPITAAVVGVDLGSVPIASYDVTDCRQSTSQPIWAAVTLRPKPGQSVAQQTVVLERLGSIWTIHSYAAGPTGCDAPAPVPGELRTGC